MKRNKHEVFHYEHQISREFLDLQNSLVYCKKNPGHRRFVPARTFNLANLPAGCQDPELVCCIHKLAALTIKLTSKLLPKQIQTLPQSGCLLKGSENVVGSGWVYRVTLPKRQNRNTLLIQETSSTASHTDFAYVYVKTAAHNLHKNAGELIVDQNEVTCLFDDEDFQSSGCDSLTKLCDIFPDINRDMCLLRYKTSNLNHAKKLHDIVTEYNYLHEKLTKRYEHTALFKLTIAVSHPHGCSKQISVGQFTNRYEEDGLVRYTYDTPTCPGCSGCALFVMGKSWWRYDDNVHSGCVETVNQSAESGCVETVNQSAECLDRSYTIMHDAKMTSV